MVANVLDFSGFVLFCGFQINFLSPPATVPIVNPAKGNPEGAVKGNHQVARRIFTKSLEVISPPAS